MNQFRDEEEKLRELTGDIQLNNQLINALNEKGIDLEYGIYIQKTLENEIRYSKLSTDDIEPRLNYLINQIYTISNEDEIKNIVEISSPNQRTLKFLLNQPHNTQTCFKCGAILLKTDNYCYICGLKVEDSSDELSDLEKIYNKKISHASNSRFKYAYVIYLDYIRRNRDFPDKLYNIDTDELKLKAIENHHLIKSGLTLEAIEYIKANQHILFYHRNRELRNVINIEVYEDLFKNRSTTSKIDIISNIIEYLKKQEVLALSNYEIFKCHYILEILSIYYDYTDDVYNAIENNLKIFMLDLNSFSEDLKCPQPYKCRFNESVIAKLIKILDENSIDIADLKRINNTSYDSIKSLNPKIDAKDSLICFLRLFNGESLSDVEHSIHIKYSC